ncbi:hypothetical protein BD770DRAFT_340938 [Pilaira anomala]|nr:hypothetical protein BD770DRAFT_340938 [Pilaira anomala]
MGCCYSQVSSVEVVLDSNGVARRVPAGQGTHLIRTYPDKETKMERKLPIRPSEISNLTRPQAAFYPPKAPIMTSCFSNNKKIHPNITVTDTDNEKV